MDTVTESRSPIMGVTNLSNKTILYYIIIIISILFTFTTIIKVELGHILALIIILLVLFGLTKKMNDTINHTNIELEYKQNSIGDHTFTPEFFYLDADLINLYFNVKNDFYMYNNDAYINSLKAADQLLSIRKQFELKLCPPPVVPDLTKNFEPMSSGGKIGDTVTYDLTIESDPQKCNSMLLNAYPMYLLATTRLKESMNEMQSMIITIPSNPVIHYKHKTVCNRLHVLLKRNLDIIYRIYQEKKKIHDTPITNYDGQVEYNTATGLTGITEGTLSIDSRFNFY